MQDQFMAGAKSQGGSIPEEQVDLMDLGLELRGVAQAIPSLAELLGRVVYELERTHHERIGLAREKILKE